VNCGRVAHGGAILVFLNTGLGIGCLLELLEKVEVGVVNVMIVLIMLILLLTLMMLLRRMCVVRNSS
jgi:hypothetical protein